MTEHPLDDIEREQLCDLLLELGPGAPTLLDRWTTLDLAAHLVLRENDGLAAPGLVVPGAWGRLAERRRAALTRTSYRTLVAAVRSGPPRGFFRHPWVRRGPNLNEFFVHHEDVRRAAGLGPRPSDVELDEALWRNVAFAPWFLSRRLGGVGLELEWTAASKCVVARRGSPTARLSGPPGELLLHLFGRGAASVVEIAGPEEAKAAVLRTRFGM